MTVTFRIILRSMFLYDNIISNKFQKKETTGRALEEAYKFKINGAEIIFYNHGLVCQKSLSGRSISILRIYHSLM